MVSTAHIEGLVAVLLLGALIAASRDRWLVSVVLVCLAAGFTPIVIVVLPAVLFAHAWSNRPNVPWAKLALDLVGAALVLAACALSVPDGMGWARNISEINHERTPFAPSALLGDLLNLIVRPASSDDLAAGARIAMGFASACIVLYLVLTVPRRPLDRTVGFALLAVGLLAPVLYPWFLLPGVLVLAPAATGRRRDWVITLSCGACVLTPVGFSSAVGVNMTRVALGAIAVVLIVRLVGRRLGTSGVIVRTR